MWHPFLGYGRKRRVGGRRRSKEASCVLLTLRVLPYYVLGRSVLADGRSLQSGYRAVGETEEPRHRKRSGRQQNPARSSESTLERFRPFDDAYAFARQQLNHGVTYIELILPPQRVARLMFLLLSKNIEDSVE